MSPASTLILLSALAWGPAPALAGISPGETIPGAANVDITDDGFEAMGAVVPLLVPSHIDLPDQSKSEGYYSYSLSGAWVGVSVEHSALTPGHGVLDLTADLSVWLNEPSDTFDLAYSIVWVVSGSCDGYVEAFPAYVTGSVSLDVVEGEDGDPFVDATVYDIEVTYGLTTEHIILQNCAVSTLEQVLNWFGLSIYQLVIDQADAELQDAVEDMAADIEQAIEDAFASASVDQEFDLAGATVHLVLQPSDVTVSPQGARVVMDGMAEAGQAACVATWDPMESPATWGAAPSLGHTPAGVDPAYHADMLLSSDITNQLLYAAWRSGLLCYALDEDFESFPVTTSILGMLDTDDDPFFDELFPEQAPLEVRTLPREQPTAAFTGPSDLNVEINDLGLDFVADLDHRKALALGLELNGHVGVDLDMDSATGVLDVLVDLDPANIVTTVRHAELTPGAEDTIKENFGGLLQTILQTVVAGQLEDLSYNLPSYEGVGLTALQVSPTGDADDWLGAYAGIGPVSYEGGCDDDDSGCGDGCSSPGRLHSRLAWLALAGLALAARRRR